MKNILTIFFCIVFVNFAYGQGDAPPLLQGQHQATKSVGSFIQSPNNQITKISGATALIETGNNNILLNPSFEHSVFDSSWTNAGIAVDSAETTNVIHGKKAVRIDASSETVIFRQDSTLYAAQFADGVQGLVSVRIKSNVALKVCSRQGGTTSTTNCVDVVANNKWGLYKVPMILGATSNGISIASTGLVTGTVYIDDAFVGAVDLSATQSFDTTCDTISCATIFSAKVSSAGVVSSENLEFINSNCTLTGVADFTCNFNPSTFTVTPNCTMTAQDADGGAVGNIFSQSSSTIVLSTVRAGVSDTRFAFNLICQKQGADYTAAIQAQKDFQKSKISSYSSTNADTDWANISNVSAGTFITATTTNPTFGTVETNKAQWKRQGSDLLLRWDFRRSTAGTAGSGGYLINIPAETGCTIDLTKAPASSPVGSGELSAVKNSNVGTFYYSDTNNEGVGHVFPYSSTQLTAAFIYAGTASASIWWGSASGNMNSPTVQAINIDARIPCANWQNSNIIIGQFNGLESCTNTLECTDTFSAKISAAGVVSDENVDWINGNASIGGTSQYTLTFKTGIFSLPPTCTITNKDTNNFGVDNVSESASLLSYGTVNTGNGVNVAAAVNLICQKQGVDYIGKTAKAVASSQNTRTPGLDYSVVYSAYITSTGSISNEYGDFINGTCTVSGNVKTCPLNGFTSSPICTVNPIEGNTNSVMSKITALSQTSVSFAAIGLSGNAVALDMTLMCHGVKQ
jgi:hypothetical protein